MIYQAIIQSNQEIAQDTYEMKLGCNQDFDCQPGQFIQIQIPGFFLRRPISISSVQGNVITIVYKVVGQGTLDLSKMKEQETLNVFGPLGNGFSIQEREKVTLVGGGVGVPPLVQLAKTYRNQDTQVHVVLGFNTSDQIFYQDVFEQLGCDVTICTMDGSYGIQGTIVDGIQEHHIPVDYIQSCGPLPMLKAVVGLAKDGEISLESRMACGIGACMGCVIQDKEGTSWRICKDGPVFSIQQEVQL